MFDLETKGNEHYLINFKGLSLTFFYHSFIEKLRMNHGCQCLSLSQHQQIETIFDGFQDCDILYFCYKTLLI